MLIPSADSVPAAILARDILPYGVIKVGIAGSMTGQILSDFHKNYWIMMFAELFPYRRGGLEEDRKVAIGMNAYLGQLSSRRFAVH
jgi:hypothetical protein